MDFKKKVSLITGASRGIGLAIAKRFNKEGSDLYLVSRSFSDDYLENFDTSQGQKIETIPCDLSDTGERRRLIEEINSKTHLDFLVNNAGLLTSGMLQDIDPDYVEQTIAVNLTATIMLSRAFLPKMLERGSGLIINNASVSGEFYFPGSQVYAATKGGVVLFTKSLHLELEKTGVGTLLLITPGVQTNMYEQLKREYSSFLHLDFLSAITPEQWTDKIFKCIEKGRSICYPTGNTRAGLFLNRHLPSLFEKGMLKYFKGQS